MTSINLKKISDLKKLTEGMDQKDLTKVSENLTKIINAKKAEADLLKQELEKQEQARKEIIDLLKKTKLSARDLKKIKNIAKVEDSNEEATAPVKEATAPAKEATAPVKTTVTFPKK